METTIAALQFTVVASAKITAGKLVGSSNKPATAADTVIGLALSNADEGEAVTVLAVGLADVEAGGSIKAGDKLAADDNGRPIVATKDSFGLALNAATAGQTVTVLIR